MKVLFDTNVWLDIILSREGFWEASLTALYDCIDEDDDLCVIATSLKDVFFLVERLKDANVAYESVERMLELARPSPLTKRFVGAPSRWSGPTTRTG